MKIFKKLLILFIIIMPIIVFGYDKSEIIDDDCKTELFYFDSDLSDKESIVYGSDEIAQYLLISPNNTEPLRAVS